jgi:hypothetical protein
VPQRIEGDSGGRCGGDAGGGNAVPLQALHFSPSKPSKFASSARSSAKPDAVHDRQHANAHEHPVHRLPEIVTAAAAVQVRSLGAAAGRKTEERQTRCS